MKKISFLMLLALALFFTLMGCREEDLYVQKSESTQLSSTEDIHKRYQSSFESYLTVQKNLKKIQITNSLQKASAKINQNAFAKVQFADMHIYEKVVDTEKNVTTYSLPLITYTASTPYFLKHLITIENGIEKSGFIKIIPSQPYTVNTEALDNFTGTVQILYDDLSVFSSSTFVKGVGQTTSTDGTNSSALSKFECWNTVNIIVHGCTRGKNHPPGTKCDSGEISDGYYEITTMMSCGEVDQHLSAPPGFAVMMGGGGGMSMNFYNLLYHPDFLYLDYVSQPESANILGMLAVLAYNGTFTISEVNEKVGIFFNNPQLLNDFNDLQLTINNNAGTSGMAGVFDPRIVKLMQNLFDNPTQQNADFTSWATQFYMQNPNTTLAQFQNWFINGYNLQHQKNILQLSPAQIQAYKSINSAIDYSQLDSQKLLEVQGANYLYAMLNAFDIPSNPTSQNIQSALNSMCCPYPSFIIFPQVFTQNEIQMVASNYIFLRKHTNWNQFTCLWEASKETVHLLLDFAGLVPAIGEFCDLSNATIYAIDGDWENAAWSTGSAIPIAGWLSTGKKFTVRFANISNKVVLNMVVDASGFIKFGDRSKLRTVLQLTDSSVHAHHIIPWEFKDFPIVQKAAYALQGFHMNDILNGIPLPTTAHLTGHAAYNTKIGQVLAVLNNGDPSPLESYQRLTGFASYLKNLIQNNPNLNLGQIAALINYP